MTTDDTTTADAPLGRRAQAKVERRQALIEATIDCIAEHGLSGTTLARVTEQAGTSIGLANFHFETKESLFEAVLQHLADAERKVWQDRAAEALPDPVDRLLALIDARFDPRICDARTLAVWFAFWGDAGARAIYRRVVESSDDARLGVLVAVIQDLQAGAGRADGDAEKTALGLEAFFDGLWLNMLLYPEDFPRTEVRRRAVEHLVALFPAHFDAHRSGAARPATTATRKDQRHAP